MSKYVGRLFLVNLPLRRLLHSVQPCFCHSYFHVRLMSCRQLRQPVVVSRRWPGCCSRPGASSDDSLRWRDKLAANQPEKRRNTLISKPHQCISDTSITPPTLSKKIAPLNPTFQSMAIVKLSQQSFGHAIGRLIPRPRISHNHS